MTLRLERALKELKKPDEEADDVAAWDAAFARSQPQLAKLAAKVREDIRQGRVRDIEVDEL